MNLGTYGLLYLDAGERGSPNDTPDGFEDQVGMYAYSALGLSRSLQIHGVEFTLLTNRKDLVARALGDAAPSLRLMEIEFSSEIPTGLLFYSSHFKLDVYRYFATRPDEYAVLCDLDMICINDFPDAFYTNVNSRTPMCYDISDQVLPAWGRKSITGELEAILDAPSEGRWTGGGFLGGPSEFFAELVDEIVDVFPNYLKDQGSFYHVGDEAPMSAALEKMRRRGRYVADIGTLGVAGVYWNCEVLHPQKPFEYFSYCTLLHLPADKQFLADIARQGIVGDQQFLAAYRLRRHPPLLTRSRARLRTVRGQVGRRVRRYVTASGQPRSEAPDS
jgi:hypothetical protein